MSTAKKTLYAAIGASGIALEKARALPQRVSTLPKTLADRTTELNKIDVRELPKMVVAVGQSVPERATKLVEEAVGLSDKAAKRFVSVYRDLTTRGEIVTKKVERSAPTKRAAAQTKSARAKVKAASTSVVKAVEATSEAAVAAVDKAASEQAG